VDVVKLCDGILSIPTFGVKNSLNVATAASVFCFEVVRQWTEVENPN
jgi:23S rRNA (guanosine2251-2'-O)-methyltransferase